MSDLQNEPVTLKVGRPGTRKGKYEEPEVIEFVVEKRNENKTWAEIADLLKLRGYDKITPTEVSRIHKVALTRSINVHNTASESMEDFTDDLNLMRAKSLRQVRLMVEKLEQYQDLISQDEDLPVTQQIIKFLSLAPTLKILLTEIREEFKLAASVQDKIITEQKQMVWSEQQMIEYASEFMETYLRDLEKQGKISIKDRTILK